MSNVNCSVIVVSHNSEPFLTKCLQSLENQTKKPAEVIIVDSGSEKLDYLYELSFDLQIKIVIGEKEMGFCKANNLGIEHLSPESSYVFFLNPDAFVFQNFIERAVAYMENPHHANCGAITGTTFGYDIRLDQATGKYDTTGIFQKWYGKWYDRGQGSRVNPLLYRNEEELTAICGAVFFSRRQAIESIMLHGREVFNESFYMYKDDIDLSLRLKKKRWKLVFHPDLFAYHCRGWSNRKQVSYLLRLYSAKNELKIHLQQRSITGIVYSSIKFFAVRVLDI